MTKDLEPIFNEYEKLRANVDAIFRHMEREYPECVKCRPGCSDCCNALFDLPLVEAMYINRAFKDKFSYGKERSEILEKAARVDRQLARLKKDMYQAEKAGTEPAVIMRELATHRMPCPLLNDNNECALYEDRPITCRLYGIPQAIGGNGHVCGFSAFQKGCSYPTVQLEKIQGRLDELGSRVEKLVESRFTLTEIYIPLSMALITEYDDKFLGIGKEEPED